MVLVAITISISFYINQKLEVLENDVIQHLKDGGYNTTDIEKIDTVYTLKNEGEANYQALVYFSDEPDVPYIYARWGTGEIYQRSYSSQKHYEKD